MGGLVAEHVQNYWQNELSIYTWGIFQRVEKYFDELHADYLGLDALYFHEEREQAECQVHNIALLVLHNLFNHLLQDHDIFIYKYAVKNFIAEAKDVKQLHHKSNQSPIQLIIVVSNVAVDGLPQQTEQSLDAWLFAKENGSSHSFNTIDNSWWVQYQERAHCSLFDFTSAIGCGKSSHDMLLALAFPQRFEVINIICELR